jgi:hypothetical protein
MKQRNDVASLGIPSSDAGTLALVTVKTGKSLILYGAFSAVLPRDDVVDVEGTRVREFRHVAIFTAPMGSLPDLADQILSQELRALSTDWKPGLFRATRARECITDKTFAMLTYPSSSAVSSGVSEPSLDCPSIPACEHGRYHRNRWRIRYRAASGEIAALGAWMSRAHMAGSKSRLTLSILMIPVYVSSRAVVGSGDWPSEQCVARA